MYNDRELLARTLQAEAGGEGLQGMLAAGSVINNRVNTGGYGNGLRDVILKPGQFSAWNSLTGYAGGEGGLNMTQMTPNEEAYKAADMLLSGNYQDPTGGATHYYNPSAATPKWGAQSGGDWQRIGNHIFGNADAGRGQMTPNSRQQQPGQARASSMGQSPEPEQERVGGIVGKMFPNLTRDGLDRVSLALMGMSSFPTPGMQMTMADTRQRISDRRDDRVASKKQNKTIEALRKAGVPERDLEIAMSDPAYMKALMGQLAKSRLGGNETEPTTARLKYQEMISMGVDPREAMQRAYGGSTQGDETTAVQTLHQRAVRGGLEPGTDAYKQFMVQGGAESGMSLEVAPDGTVRFGTGGASAKPLTEGQSKDTTYAIRAEGALPILDQYDTELANIGARALNADPTGILRGRMQSPEYQQAKQAGDEFLQAILRKDTGAAITADEQTLYGQTYLPQPGDGPEVIKQKRNARSRALEALKAGLPPSAILAQERALDAGDTQQIDQGGGAAVAPPPQLNDEDKKLWPHMNESERKILLEEYGVAE